MTSKAERIAQAVLGALVTPTMDGVPPTRIYRDMEGALGAAELPAVVVEMGDEPPPEPGGTLIGRKMRELEVRVQTLASACVGASPYAVADPVVVEAHDRLAADPTLGGLAFGFAEGGTGRRREDAERNIGSVTKIYLFRYHTTESSLES